MNAASRLQHFLLDGGAQLVAGEERGGVAGTLDAHRRPAYVYGEITGYYLHWLATPLASRHDDRRRAAQSALDWIGRRYGAGELPPTRIELGAPTDDWRNRAQFCFDLAMLVGGLAAATRAGLIDAPVDVLARLYDALLPFSSANGLIAYRTGDDTVLAPRWSTRNGPFLVKAAARMLSADDIAPLPAPLKSAAAKHATMHAPDVTRAFADPVHPTLYFLEGHLALPNADRAGAAAVLRRIAAMRDSQGTLPESLETPHVRRSDIIAQVLRVGLFLRASGELDASDESVLDGYAHALASRVREDGGLPFDPNADGRLSNVWSAMFAEQALTWHARWRSGQAIGAVEADIV